MEHAVKKPGEEIDERKSKINTEPNISTGKNYPCSENKQAIASKIKRTYKRKKRYVKSGRILTDFAYAKSKKQALKILFKGSKVFSKLLPASFTISDIDIPEDLIKSQLILINALKAFQSGENIAADGSINYFLNSYNLCFPRCKGINEKGQIINDPSRRDSDDFSWNVIIAYNLILVVIIQN